MSPRMPVVDFRLGDTVELRKPHPCGSYTWEVVRLGADIGLKCTTCGRRVLLPRSTVERRMKRFLERGPEVTAVDA
jgi:hypothetical protein